ncbi:hypothetical protein RBSH_04944 [Rhodopirellula baltica SH28]|uniref:Uncharacterized protein n=1 Tax=Rhodopirellula baltica SH28 TaxID=993517 RepID=K5C9N3_RHOBT|nr:hypothetical protein RBSH_04944 [Rhodopirellula baltica SH28]
MAHCNPGASSHPHHPRWYRLRSKTAQSFWLEAYFVAKKITHGE